MPWGKMLILKEQQASSCRLGVTGVRSLTVAARRIGSEDFGQFRGKSALRFMLALSSAAAFGGWRPMVVGWWPVDGASVGSLFRFDGAGGGSRNLDSAFRRLRRVGSEDFVLERGSVEAANDRLHLVSRGRLDKRESLGFLRFVIPDYFNRVRDKVFGGEPLFNVVRSDPNGQITQKDSKTHSVLNSLRGLK
jgi:hypothetical protein